MVSVDGPVTAAETPGGSSAFAAVRSSPTSLPASTASLELTGTIPTAAVPSSLFCKGI